jgi:hypothetical protein
VPMTATMADRSRTALVVMSKRGISLAVGQPRFQSQPTRNPRRQFLTD